MRRSGVRVPAPAPSYRAGYRAGLPGARRLLHAPLGPSGPHAALQAPHGRLQNRPDGNTKSPIHVVEHVESAKKEDCRLSLDYEEG